jgi:hypothetical protein
MDLQVLRLRIRSHSSTAEGVDAESQIPRRSGAAGRRSSSPTPENGAQADAVYEESGGNPFFLSELVATCIAKG